MTIVKFGVTDVLYLRPKIVKDKRGYFARTFCIEELSYAVPAFSPVQINLSFNKNAHTLRGLHFQTHPLEEAKIVQCLEGSLFDVAVDLRPDSPTFRQWVGRRLSAAKKDMLYIPVGFAHGFLTHEPNTLVQYFMSTPYVAEASSGIRYDDPKIGIEWPDQPSVIAEKDRHWPLL